MYIRTHNNICACCLQYAIYDDTKEKKKNNKLSSTYLISLNITTRLNVQIYKCRRKGAKYHIPYNVVFNIIYRDG